MKWIHKNQNQPYFINKGQDFIMVDSGYNGAELAEIATSSGSVQKIGSRDFETKLLRK